jgi:hypothetical protein
LIERTDEKWIKKKIKKSKDKKKWGREIEKRKIE